MAARPTCAQCLRPPSACLCRWICPVDNEVELLVLQHPLEQPQAKGTLRLLHMSLARCQVLTGEQWAGSDEAVLRGALTAPLAASGAAPMTVLLYPATADRPAVWNAADCLAQAPAAGMRLVLLDATWRKSRKMLQLNPVLQTLPRLELGDVPMSRYVIRKAQHPHQLSSLEAAVLALQQLESAPQRYEPLLQAFEGFVAQLSARPQRTGPNSVALG
jgi:DTW domain-containing protein YfiP